MWQIIGAGAIGCLWAANLLRTGQKVHLISRKENTEQRLTYQDLNGEKTTWNCPNSTQLVCTNSPILVCVKAHQVEHALHQHIHKISPKQVIILMHNGMGSAEQVVKLLPNNPIICATTANASLLKSPLNIKQTGLGITYLGAFNQQASVYSNLQVTLNNALNNTHWCEDIEQKLWLKLLINIAINPLTAVHNINNGKLKTQCYQHQIEQLITEAMPVLDALQLTFDKHMLLTTINKVIEATASNYSSMNRDIHFKRTTENDNISGYLLKKALQHHIETPLITSLYEQVKTLESRLPALSSIE